MDISKELLPYIYSAYYGCPVSHPCDQCAFYYKGTRYIYDDAKQKNRPVLYGDWSGGTNPEMSCESHTDWDDIKLMLKRPENISDEHALELCKLGGYGGAHNAFIGRQLITQYARKVSNVIGIDWFRVLDFLRKNGYDCGYGDIPSLIDAGIATEIQK